MTVLPCSALSEGQQRKWETQRAQQEGWETAIQCCPGHTLPPVGRAELWEVPIGTFGADTEHASLWGCDSVMGEVEPEECGDCLVRGNDVLFRPVLWEVLRAEGHR